MKSSEAKVLLDQCGSWPGHYGHGVPSCCACGPTAANTRILGDRQSLEVVRTIIASRTPSAPVNCIRNEVRLCYLISLVLFIFSASVLGCRRRRRTFICHKHNRLISNTHITLWRTARGVVGPTCGRLSRSDI